MRSPRKLLWREKRYKNFKVNMNKKRAKETANLWPVRSKKH